MPVVHVAIPISRSDDVVLVFAELRIEMHGIHELRICCGCRISVFRPKLDNGTWQTLRNSGESAFHAFGDVLRFSQLVSCCEKLSYLNGSFGTEIGFGPIYGRTL